MLEIPLLAEKTPTQLNRTLEVFAKEYDLTPAQVFEIFEGFPFLFCVDTRRVAHFLNVFKGYGFDADQVIHILKRAGGILTMSKTAVSGMYNIVQTVIGIKEEEFTQIVAHYPEMLHLGRHNLFLKKFLMIQKNASVSELYMRHLFRRHPDIFLTSVAALTQKMKLVQDLGIDLKTERSFPIFLKLNYGAVIRPRIEMLRKEERKIDFTEAIRGTDQEFCDRFNIDPEELDFEKTLGKVTAERDALWQYVPGV